jgi:hypothetical protein
MLDFEILRLANLLIKISCIAPLSPAVIVVRGFVFYPLFCMLLINGSYLTCDINTNEQMRGMLHGCNSSLSLEALLAPRITIHTRPWEITRLISHSKTYYLARDVQSSPCKSHAPSSLASPFLNMLVFSVCPIICCSRQACCCISTRG